MNEQELTAEIEGLFEVPFLLSMSVDVIDFLTMVLIFAGVIILFTSSKRPGRIMMLVGLGLSTIIPLPFLFGEPHVEQQKLIAWYLPLVSGLFAAVGSFGFFKFALSFKN